MTALRLARLDIEPGEVGAPELIQGQRPGPGVPQPHGPVRVASAGQALDGDVEEGAGQDRQVLPAGEPAPVADSKGYVVDLLPTTIPAGYVADAFVAIHADGDETGTARGFKIAHGDRRTPYDEALLQVLGEEYWKSTDLPVDPNLTPGMLEYYAWRWERFQTAVSPYTPAVIIETGFISSAADRAVLLLRPDKVVDGIVNGVERFLREVPRDAVFRDDLVFPRATPAPSTP